MACEACSTKVNKALTSLKGIYKVESVCHEAGQAVLTFDPTKLSKEKVIAAVDKTGFKVTKETEVKKN